MRGRVGDCSVSAIASIICEHNILLYGEPVPVGVPVIFNGPQDIERLSAIGDKGRYDVHITRSFFIHRVRPSTGTLASTTWPTC